MMTMSPQQAEHPQQPPQRRTLRMKWVFQVVVPLTVACVGVVSVLMSLRETAPDSDLTLPGGVGQLVDSANRPASALSAQDSAKASAQRVLDERAAAIMRRDPQRWQATFDDPHNTFGRRQQAVFANLRDVPVASWRYVQGGSGVFEPLKQQRLAELGAHQGWVVPCILEYQLADPSGQPIAGQSPVRREQTFTIVQRGTTWKIVTDEDGKTSGDIWDLGPVKVLRGQRSLVLGLANGLDLKRLAREADAAAPVVDGVWGTDWPRLVTILAPASQGQMAKLLDMSDEHGMDQIAAVTTGEVSKDALNATTGDRIIVNPNGFDELGDVGRAIVLRHEMTHVATRATGDGAVPKWLSEGFADYVGYQRSDVQAGALASDARAEVKANGVPVNLPGPESFDARRAPVGPAYSGAWVAVDLIARQYGPAKVVELYRATARRGSQAAPTRGNPTAAAVVNVQLAFDEAVAQVLGIPASDFLRQWQQELHRQAGSS